MSSLPGPPAPRGPRRFVVPALLAAALVVAGVGVYLVIAPTAPVRFGPTEIDLLPSAGTRSGCIVDTPGQPRPTLDLREGTLQANTYSVPTGTVGHVGMCYDAANGSLFSYANWSTVGAAGGWFSYPQVAYGVDLYDGVHTTYTPQSPAWRLPQTVAATVNESLWVTANYSLRAPPASDVDGYDLSFDDFLSYGLPPTLEVPPFVEVEIFLAHNISYPFTWVHWSMPTLVNASVVVRPWDVAYWCHGTDNGTNGNVSFDFSYDGQGTHGLAAGTLGVNLSAVFAEVERLLPGATCWTGSDRTFAHGFYLGEEDLGSEDGAIGGTSFTYNWTVTTYCLHTLVRAAALSPPVCASGRAPGPYRSARTSGDGGGFAAAVPQSVAVGAPRRRRVPDAVRKRTFGNDPAAYDRARLPYPARLFRLLERRCGLGPASEIFEVGPGTGIASRELLRRRPKRYVAVEADPRLSRYLARHVLAGRPRASVLVAPFERARLAPASFDLGVAASSFHWLPERSALRRVARLLKPGGWWASWNNHHGDPFRASPFNAALQPLYQVLAGAPARTSDDRREAQRSIRARLRALRETNAFDRVRCDELHWKATLTPAQARALWASFSDIAVLPSPWRSWFLDGLEMIASDSFHGRVPLHVYTPVFSARRR